MLSTAGGLAFVGDLDRRFRAFDVQTGQILWETRLGTSVQGFPVSFTAGGNNTSRSRPVLVWKPADGAADYRT